MYYNDDEIEKLAAENEARQEVYEDEEAQMPKILFKYKPVANQVDLERACKILAENTIYMPSVSELNDPLEGTNAMMIDGNYAERNKILAKQRVLSLSESCFLSTLWAHYASNYSGICFGYRRKGEFARAQKVKYVGKQTTWSTDPGISVLGDILKKSSEWGYEQEWRLVYSVESDEEECLLKYKSEELACVLFGCKMSDSFQHKIKEHIAPSVVIYTVHPDEQKFCLYAKKDKDAENKKIYSIDDLLDDLSQE